MLGDLGSDEIKLEPRRPKPSVQPANPPGETEPQQLRGAKDGPPVELAVSVKWKALTALRIADQNFDAAVDITFETDDGPERKRPIWNGFCDKSGEARSRLYQSC